MIVYITTNLKNGKKYIGSDSNNNPNYLGGGTGFNKAVKKYGRKNFKKQILATATSHEEMRDLEEYYISYYNAHKSSLFYNRSDKGHGQGSKERHWNFGKTLSETTKSKKSKSMLGKKMHSTEQKQKWSELKKGIKPTNFSKPKNAQGKIILQYDLNNNFIKEWKSKAIAARELGFNHVSIGNVCNGLQKSYKNFNWRYK